MQEFLDKFTEHTTFTHELPRIANDAKSELIAQHPFLANVDSSTINPDTVWDVLMELENIHGSQLEVTPMPSSRIPYMNPVESFQFAAPDKEITIIDPKTLC